MYGSPILPAPPAARTPLGPCRGSPGCDVAWLTGVVAGCARGLLAGRRRALWLVIGARFGPPDSATEARIADLDPATLDRCLVAAVTATEPASVWSA